MHALSTNLYLYVRNLLEREEGQDLVEYALVVALIAFGAITGMGFLATGINNAFSNIATTLTSQRHVVWAPATFCTRCIPRIPLCPEFSMGMG